MTRAQHRPLGALVSHRCRLGPRAPTPRPRGLTRARSPTGPSPAEGRHRRRGSPPPPLLGCQPRRAPAKLAARRPSRPWSPPSLTPPAVAPLPPPAAAALQPPLPVAPPRPPAAVLWSSQPAVAPKGRQHRVSRRSPLSPCSRPPAMPSTSAAWWGRPHPSSAPWQARKGARWVPPCKHNGEGVRP
jgi:hypothetical protein